VPQRDIALPSGDVDSDSLCTPPKILDPLYELFGGIVDTDPCSNPHSIVRARQSFHEGGLLVPWSYRGREANTYENHPYSTNEPWMAKAVYEMRVGHIRELVVLCMAAPSTLWWRGFMVRPRTNPRVVFTERLKFLGADGRPIKIRDKHGKLHESGARFDTALIYYPTRRSRVALFDRLFAHVTRWSTWGR